MQNHSGNLLNQVTFEEHDGTLNAKKVSLVSAATIYAVTTGTNVNSGNVTLNPSPNLIGLVTVANQLTIEGTNVTHGDGEANARYDFTISSNKLFQPVYPYAFNGSTWDRQRGDTNGMFAQLKGNITLSDPKGFIGLVTIVGSLSPAAGNITLDPGSRTGVVGNITLTDSKGFIGLTTTTLGASPAFIGIVTVANPGSAALTGNVTLDPGSRTGIVGNITLSDSKGFIGLVTVTQASAARTITGNLTLSDPKGFIGLVTATGNVGVVGNITLSDSKGYIGLVTVTQASTARTITGNLTLSDAKTFIGLTTATLGSSPAFIGLVTVANSVGNATLNPSPNFIGLVTVKASILDTFAGLATFTMSIASLATSTTGVGRQSTLIDNTTTRYTSANVYLKVFTGGLAHTPNTLINVYLLRRDNNSVGDDGVGASDAAATFVNAPLLGNILVNASNVSTAYYGVFDTSPLGPLGPQWGIGLVNQTGAALGGTESNHLKNWIGINRSLT